MPRDPHESIGTYRVVQLTEAVVKAAKPLPPAGRCVFPTRPVLGHLPTGRACPSPVSSCRMGHFGLASGPVARP